MNFDKKIHIDCECGCSVARVGYWDEDEEVYLHVFSYKSASFWEKIKRVFRYDSPDIEVVLSQADVYKLQKFLSQKEIVESVDFSSPEEVNSQTHG